MTATTVDDTASHQALEEAEFGTGWECWNLQAQLDFFIAKIRERCAMLKQQREDIEVTLAELGAVEKRCHDRLKELK